MCTTFLALSLIQEGYSVWANADASGTFSKRIADDANDRMRAAGVQVVSMFAITTDLMRDWRNTPGAPELLPYYDKYVSFFPSLHVTRVTDARAYLDISPRTDSLPEHTLLRRRAVKFSQDNPAQTLTRS